MGWKSAAIAPPVPLATYLSASLAARSQQNAANLVNANAYLNAAARVISLEYMAGYQAYRPTLHGWVTDGSSVAPLRTAERTRTSVIARVGFGGKTHTMARAA